jgi:hypothetical protein
MSWDEAFASHYDEWSAHMTADIAFYVSLPLQADGPLVELAIGNGRVAIPIAQATGQRVIGIDSSPALLDQARRRAAAAGVELALLEGDMRDLALAEPAASSTARFVRSCIYQLGLTAAEPSSGSRRRSGRTGDSPGMPSPLTTGWPRASTVFIRKSRYPILSGMP